MTVPTEVSVEQYLDGTFEFEPDAEFVDGKIDERPAEDYDHVIWPQAIELWFLRRATEWNIRVRCGLRVQVPSSPVGRIEQS